MKIPKTFRKPLPLLLATLLTSSLFPVNAPYAWADTPAVRPIELDDPASPSSWFLSGSSPQSYETLVEGQTRIFRSKESSSGFGTVMRQVPVDLFRGKRIRFQADVSTQDIVGWSGLWMRVDGEPGEILAFDNMDRRPISGTTETTSYAVVLDVPVQARRIVLGLLIDGTGEARMSLPRVEEVGLETPVTGAQAQDPLTEWMMAGSQPDSYEVVMEAAGTDAVARLQSKEGASPADEFGTLMHSFLPFPYHGKRLRFSAYVRTEAVEDWAGLWMRVDGPNGDVLSFDNMADRPLLGTSDEALYSVVLDVPQEARGIALGILLNGRGRTWIRAPKVEVVGLDVPVTGTW